MTQFRVDLIPGEVFTRRQLVLEYGGSTQGGIVPSNTSDTVFLFSDPIEAANFGYTYDGFSRDASVFYYTGAGQDGDQQLKGGNRAILTHAEQGRTIHAFRANGTVPGGQAKKQLYIGAFVLDPARKFERMPGKDRSGATRTVVVFRLLPIHAVDEAIVEIVGFSDMSAATQAMPVAVELNSTEFFETTGREGQLAVRRESALVDSFIASQRDHEFSRWAINLPAEHTRLLTDVYDGTTRTLYEAKSLAGRNEARLALGQLYDYRRHIDVDGLECSVLLPERPKADLRDLLIGSGLGITFREGEDFIAEAPTVSAGVA